MQRLGISRTDDIVCYDNVGVFSAPRVAWTLQFFGAERVRILNGGLKKWVAEGRKIESGPEKKGETVKDVQFNSKNKKVVVRTYSDINKLVSQNIHK